MSLQLHGLFTPQSLSPEIYHPGTPPVRPLPPAAFDKMYGSPTPQAQRKPQDKTAQRFPNLNKQAAAIPIPVRPGTPLHKKVVSPQPSPPLPTIKEEPESVDDLVHKKQLEIEALKKQLYAMGKRNGKLSKKCRKIQDADEKSKKQHEAIVKVYESLISKVLDDFQNGENREDIVAHIAQFRKELPLTSSLA